MAYVLKAWIQCRSPAETALIYQFLKRDSRPKFEEDVDPKYLPIYKSIETVDFPDEIEIHNDLIWICWSDRADFGMTEFQELLNNLDLHAVLIFEVPDNPMSSDSDDDEVSGWFWVYENSRYVKKSPLEVLSALPESLTYRFA